MTCSKQMRTALSALLLTSALLPTIAMANGVSENDAWRFQSTAEAANRAYIEDMRMKRSSGFYNSPQYNTYVDTQNNFNCSNSANSSGNGGSNSAVANTPNANGASGSATGNQNTNSAGGIDAAYNPVLNAGQDNLGTVISDVMGDSVSSASGNVTRQVLNTFQDNLGTQASTIVGSNACSFPGAVGEISGQ
ncbi:MAG: hypothetical protein KA199_09435 [Sphingorhabdus sp.]|nr:hypothetical protein [Sphingorhabdus sp.]